MFFRQNQTLRGVLPGWSLEGGLHIFLLFLMLGGLPVGFLCASLFFLALAPCPYFFQVFPVTHWSCVSA